MVQHRKLKCVEKFRTKIDSYLLQLPLPNCNPDVVSALSVLSSLLFVFFLESPWWALVFLVLTLLLDWGDGLIAKKYKRTSEHGYIVDVVADRFSEGIMFIPFFMPWFFLFVLNTVLSIWSFTKRRHIILPLRHIFLVYYVVVFVF